MLDDDKYKKGGSSNPFLLIISLHKVVITVLNCLREHYNQLSILHPSYRIIIRVFWREDSAIFEMLLTQQTPKKLRLDQYRLHQRVNSSYNKSIIH